jgi:TRAP-type C4-dicarboxylate transport system substrate-binding protein
MSRRRFLKASALVGAAALSSGARGWLASARAQQRPSFGVEPPVRIFMGGYGPPTTSFSLGLKRIGDRLEQKLGKDVSPRYVYNVMDFGYSSSDLAWLVDAGVLTLAYRTMTEGIPELEVAALPFLFPDTASARAAMDGALGRAATQRIEAQTNYRVLGYFENGFRHVSNNVRPIRTPADFKGLKIRVLAVQARTFELLGADPRPMSLSAAIAALKAGKLDGQENPFANTVTYGIYPYQRYHTATYHSYLSRPIFVHRPSFDAWPQALRTELRAAVKDAVDFQRERHDEEEQRAAETIREAGGEIVELTAAQREAFVQAVAPIYAEAKARYSERVLKLVNL